MNDLVYVLTIVALFALLWALARVCEWAKPR